MRFLEQILDLSDPYFLKFVYGAPYFAYAKPSRMPCEEFKIL